MRRLHLGIAGGLALVALGGLAAWRLTRPAKLGLERSRVVLVSGEVTVDGARARPTQLLAVGSTVHTGHGTACFSLHGSRVCAGANADLVLAEVGETSATVEAKRGRLIVASVRDDVHVTVPTGSVIARAATVAVEDGGFTGMTVRVLDGTARVTSTGQAEVFVEAPNAIALKDGKKRPSAQTLEAEERGIVLLAGSWQGTAGATLQVDAPHGRVEVDGADVGPAPAAVLVVEGTHTLVVRDNGREVTRETLKLGAGETVVRGG
jgi:hypothetical protein